MKLPNTYLTLHAQDVSRLKPYPDSLPLLICGLDGKNLACAVKNYLSEFYGADTQIVFSCGDGEKNIKLKDLGCQPFYGRDARVFIPQSDGFDKPRYNFGDLLRIISRLTAPDGCPWDKEQTHQSIRINLIEEAYEAVDAIDSLGGVGSKGEGTDALIEELGDVLLQVVLHSDIGLRVGEFSTGDVITALCRKLFTRHTHIFGTNKAADADDALQFWNSAKAKEKHYSTLKQQLQKYPRAFSAALKAQKIFGKFMKGLQRNFLQKVSLRSSKTFKLFPFEPSLECSDNPLLKLFTESINSLFGENPSEVSAGEFLFLAVGLTALFGFDAEVALNNYCRRVIDKSDSLDLLKIITDLRAAT